MLTLRATCQKEKIQPMAPAMRVPKGKRTFEKQKEKNQKTKPKNKTKKQNQNS
ncbi:hypothetical protein [Cytobacillus pseudoceanisediminis]